MQSDISVLIIEDEETWMEQIKYHLGQFGYNPVGFSYNVEDALVAINQNNFDIALLDINLNGKNSGISLGKLISGTLKKPFIFITSSLHEGIVEETAAALPSGFLTKPFNPAALYISIQSALHHFSGDNQSPVSKKQPVSTDSFFVKLGNKYVKVEWENVVYLRSEVNYTHVVTHTKDTYLIRSSLQRTLQHIIPDDVRPDFVQVNRAEVLHIKHIEKIAGDEAVTPIQSFNITDRYLKSLKQRLNIVS